MTNITETLKQSVVVFSQNYLPINRVDIKRAITLLLTGKAEPVYFLEGAILEVRSANLILQIPGQIRLHQVPEWKWKVPPVNRKEVLKRDKYQCQYCSSKHNLTLDHVLPRSRGGKHKWDNVVAACANCNGKKGNRTPEEAKMPLKTKPISPIHPAVTLAAQFWQQSRL